MVDDNSFQNWVKVQVKVCLFVCTTEFFHTQNLHWVVRIYVNVANVVHMYVVDVCIIGLDFSIVLVLVLVCKYGRNWTRSQQLDNSVPSHLMREF